MAERWPASGCPMKSQFFLLWRARHNKNYGKSSIMRSRIGAGRFRGSSGSLRGTGLALHNYTASRKASSRGNSVRRRLGGGDGASSDRNTLAFMSRSASI